MNPTLPLLKSLAEPKEAPPIKWTIDCPTRGVVFLDVAVVQDASTVPLHWRAGNWTKPPLDLRLNEMGGLESIQFAFQDESVDSGQSSLPDVSEVGLPTFDVHGWPADRYIDVRILVETVRLPSGELYTAIGDAQPQDAQRHGHRQR